MNIISSASTTLSGRCPKYHKRSAAALPTALILGVILILSAVLLTACTAEKPETPALRIAWDASPGNYPLLLADKLGLYQKHGLQVQLVKNLAPNTTPALFASGQIDSFNCTLHDALVLRDRLDLRIIMVANASAGADAILAIQPISTPADLKGKRLGLYLDSVTGGLLVQQMLVQYGLTLADVQIVDLSPEQVPAALGVQIDAGYTQQPYIAQAKANENAAATVIFTSADIPGLLPHVMPFRTDLLQARPAQVRAFLAAVFEASDYWQSEPDRANALIAEYLAEAGLSAVTEQPAAAPTASPDASTLGLQIFTLQDNLTAFTSGSDTTSLYHTTRLTLDYMIAVGLLSHPILIDEKLLDHLYLESAGQNAVIEQPLESDK